MKKYYERCLMNTEKYTITDVKKAITKIKRRVDIKSNDDISISKIAKTVGCTREYLYSSKFSDILDPFKKKKNVSKDEVIENGYLVTTENQKIKLGTIEYYKYRNRELHKEIDKKTIKLDKAIKVQLDRIKIKEDIKKIKEKHKNEIDMKNDIIKDLNLKIESLKRNVEFLKKIKKEK